jgi:hypothetical protein
MASTGNNAIAVQSKTVDLESSVGGPRLKVWRDENGSPLLLVEIMEGGGLPCVRVSSGVANVAVVPIDPVCAVVVLYHG